MSENQRKAFAYALELRSSSDLITESRRNVATNWINEVEDGLVFNINSPQEYYQLVELNRPFVRPAIGLELCGKGHPPRHRENAVRKNAGALLIGALKNDTVTRKCASIDL